MYLLQAFMTVIDPSLTDIKKKKSKQKEKQEEQLQYLFQADHWETNDHEIRAVEGIITAFNS